MASRTFVEAKRFVHRAPNKKIVSYVSNQDGTRAHVSTTVVRSSSSQWTRPISPPPTPPSPLTDELQPTYREERQPPVRKRVQIVTTDDQQPVIRRPLHLDSADDRPPPVRKSLQFARVDDYQPPVRRPLQVQTRGERQTVLRDDRQPPVRKPIKFVTTDELDLPREGERRRVQTLSNDEYQLPSRNLPRTPSPDRLVNIETPRADLEPTRRVVVVRPNNNRQANERTGWQGDREQEDTVSVPLVTSTGVSDSIPLLRCLLKAKASHCLEQVDSFHSTTDRTTG